MKVCQHCGSDVRDEELHCPHCGSSKLERKKVNIVNNTKSEEDKLMGYLSIAFAFIMPIIGLILSIVALSTYKQPETRKLAKIGLGISLILPAVIIIFWIIIFISIFASVGDVYAMLAMLSL